MRVMTRRKPQVRKYGFREGACACVASACTAIVELTSSSMSRVRTDQVQQREQEDPDDVHEMPVQPDALERIVPFGGVAALPGGQQQVAEQPDADDHVQGVQPGHGEIEREEDL